MPRVTGLVGRSDGELATTAVVVRLRLRRHRAPDDRASGENSEADVAKKLSPQIRKVVSQRYGRGTGGSRDALLGGSPLHLGDMVCPRDLPMPIAGYGADDGLLRWWFCRLISPYARFTPPCPSDWLL
jgi:hypothetical protein